jgi:hypothetical protein
MAVRSQRSQVSFGFLCSSLTAPRFCRITNNKLPAVSALEVEENPFNHLSVSKVEEVEAELRGLSQAELRQIRDWLDDVIEDELEFTPEFERSIQQSERERLAAPAPDVRTER